MSTSNGDTNRIWQIGRQAVRGIGSFHKTLPHDDWGEVDTDAFVALVEATRGDGRGFANVPRGRPRVETIGEEKKIHVAAAFTNPQCGLASDRLVEHPSVYAMPPAPRVVSHTTAAEMVELYWMAALRDVDLCAFDGTGAVAGPHAVPDIVTEINECFQHALENDSAPDRFLLGVDIPGSAVSRQDFTPQTLFRLGFPGDHVGPMVSQFFLRPASFGTQRIDQRQRPYVSGVDYLTTFPDWLTAQNSARDAAGQSYGQSNEDVSARYESYERYICTMRDLARFVNKDALHQAYFNAALLLLSGGARWMTGNPYHNLDNGIDKGPLADREAGFGVLGGPHILALVSEVATRALKVVWRQKWQEHLRLRPEAYGGLLHVQSIGVERGGSLVTRAYGLPDWIAGTKAANHIRSLHDTLLLPMAFTAGSPTHPSYGAGHATVAGACVTVLKAYFRTYDTNAAGVDQPVKFSTLTERKEPFGAGAQIAPWCTKIEAPSPDTAYDPFQPHNRIPLTVAAGAEDLTIEGELNKLAQNVAMGRSMGGVHWRTDNTRSLMLGEALAADILAEISTDANEKPSFSFRTFARRADGLPRKVMIERGRIFVDGVERSAPLSAL